jgi:hypothetical protein
MDEKRQRRASTATTRADGQTQSSLVRTKRAGCSTEPRRGTTARSLVVVCPVLVLSELCQTRRRRSVPQRVRHRR